MKRRWFGVFLALFSSISFVLSAAPTSAAGNGGLKGVVFKDTTACQSDSSHQSLVKIDGQTFNLSSSAAFDTGQTLSEGNKSIQVTCYINGTANNYTVSNDATGKPIAVVGGQTVDIGDVSSTNADNRQPCDAGPGFTWLICGLINTLVGQDGIVNWIRDNVIMPFLAVQPLSRKDASGNDSATYQIWASFRNIASVFFVLVFFLTILGTAVGFDNYTIKKILPHLIAGALLVPFSWYFCAFIIDIGNVLGQGMVALINPLLPQLTIDITKDWTSFFGLGAAAVAGGIALYGTAATIGLGAVLSLVIAFVGVFLTLILRQVLLTLFIVLSPLALLAWVLPNTEKWFKTWWQNFFKLVMMYPIIMLLFEAGRIFATAAGATTGSAGGSSATAATDAVKPFIQLTALIAPLFMVPFAFKFAGTGLASANKIVGRVTGAADKRFGKDSAMAKTAAQNREIKNMERGRNLADAAKNASNPLDKARLAAASRMAYRRAGHALPFNNTGRGFMSNPVKSLENEKAYGAATSTMGILDANAQNKKQGLEGETHAERSRAEMLAAQQTKIGDRARRKGLVQNADEKGEAKLAEENRAILQSGIIQSRDAQADKAGKALGFMDNQRNPKTGPLTSQQVTDAARIASNAAEAERHGNTTGTIDMDMDLNRKIMRDNGITDIEEARQLRMKQLAKSSNIEAGNKMIAADNKANINVQASADAAKAEQDRVRKAGGGNISIGQAHDNRLDAHMKAQLNSGVTEKLEAEGKEREYNRVTDAAGGRMNGTDIMESAALRNRQSLADARAAMEAPLLAKGPGGKDHFGAKEALDASRYNAVNSFEEHESATEGTLRDMKSEAKLAGIDISTGAGLQQLYQKSGHEAFEAGAIAKSKQLSTAAGDRRGVIAGEAAAIAKVQARAARRGTTVDADSARTELLNRSARATQHTKGRATAAGYGQDQGTLIDAETNPVSLGSVYDSAVYTGTRDAAAKTGQITGALEARDAEANLNHVAADSDMAMKLSARTAAKSSHIETSKRIATAIGGDRATVNADKVEHVEAKDYIETTEDEHGRKLAASAGALKEEARAGRQVIESIAKEKGISVDGAKKEVLKNASIAASISAGKETAESYGKDRGARDIFEREVKSKGGDRDAAIKSVREGIVDNATKNSRDASRISTEQALSRDRGTAQAIDTEIENEMERSGVDRATAEANVFEENMTAIGREEHISSAEKRIGIPTKARGAVKTYDAAIELASENKHIDDVKESARTKRRSEIDADAKYEENLKKYKGDAAKARAATDEYINTETENAAENAGKEEKLRIDKAYKNGEDPGFEKYDGAERTVLTAAGDAVGEESSRSEAATQARRSALSEASRSSKTPSPRTRIENNRKAVIDTIAGDAANLTAQQIVEPRSYDQAVEETLQLKERKVIEDRANQVSKLKFDELNPKYQKAITDKIKFNPFSQVPVGEVDLATGPNSPVEGLTLLARAAIKEGDWGTARAALNHLSQSNGAFDEVQKLRRLPVEEGGFGGDDWNLIDATHPSASVLKDLWDQSTQAAVKAGNSDVNKPIGVAARDFKPEKLAGINDKLMGRFLSYYREGNNNLDELARVSQEIINTSAEGTPERARAEQALKDVETRKGMLDRSITEFRKGVPEVLLSDDPKVKFGTETIRALYKDVSENDKSKIKDLMVAGVPIKDFLADKLGIEDRPGGSPATSTDTPGGTPPADSTDPTA